MTLSPVTVARYLAASPRRAGNIAFVGRADSRFVGNTKHLFLHLLAHAPDLHPTYVTLNRAVYKLLKMSGLPVGFFPDNDATEALARAGVVVVDDFHYRHQYINLFAHGAFLLQLWHGVGFKKIGFLEAETAIDLPPERRQYLREMYSGYDAVISTSPFYTENLFATSFGVKEIWETGYPRNDVLLRPPAKFDLLGSNPEVVGAVRAMGKECRVGVYAPTFRDDKSDPIRHGALDLGALSAFLVRHHIQLLVKMHQFSNQYATANQPNIHFLPNDLDIYPLLRLVDFMVTDYSSIYTDYLLLDRPVVFFPYDQADYSKRLREFQFDYDQMTPGPKCLDQASLEAALLDAIQGRDAWGAERAAARDRAFAHVDAGACGRVTERLRQKVALRRQAGPRHAAAV